MAPHPASKNSAKNITLELEFHFVAVYVAEFWNRKHSTGSKSDFPAIYGVLPLAQVQLSRSTRNLLIGFHALEKAAGIVYTYAKQDLLASLIRLATRGYILTTLDRLKISTVVKSQKGLTDFTPTWRG